MNITIINGRCVQAGSFIEGAHGNPALLIEAPLENIAAHTASIAYKDVVIMRRDKFKELCGFINAIRLGTQAGQINLNRTTYDRIEEILKPIEDAPQ